MSNKPTGFSCYTTECIVPSSTTVDNKSAADLLVKQKKARWCLTPGAVLTLVDYNYVLQPYEVFLDEVQL